MRKQSVARVVGSGGPCALIGAAAVTLGLRTTTLFAQFTHSPARLLAAELKADVSQDGRGRRGWGTGEGGQASLCLATEENG